MRLTPYFYLIFTERTNFSSKNTDRLATPSRRREYSKISEVQGCSFWDHLGKIKPLPLSIHVLLK